MLKDAGSFCESCYQFWAFRDMEPKRMVHVFHDDGTIMTTESKHIPIVICPFCDADVMLRLQKEPNAQ